MGEKTWKMISEAKKISRQFSLWGIYIFSVSREKIFNATDSREDPFVAQTPLNGCQEISILGYLLFCDPKRNFSPGSLVSSLVKLKG